VTIRLAGNPEQEVEDLMNRTREAYMARGGSGVLESEPWDIAGHSVVCIVRAANCHGHMRPKRSWQLDGKRVGYNALIGALKKSIG